MPYKSFAKRSGRQTWTSRIGAMIYTKWLAAVGCIELKFKLSGVPRKGLSPTMDESWLIMITVRQDRIKVVIRC